MPSVVELQNKYFVPLINKLPQIFHDEMNGYDFELDFSGTELDFDEIPAAFRAAGVSEEEVTLFMKNEIECREVKIERIRDLLEWLEKNRCRIFDYDAFRMGYNEIFDSDYTCVILHGEPQKPKLKDVSVESVSDISELKCTDLTHTPILYCVSEENIPIMQSDLNNLRSRKDVRDDQIFFIVDKSLDLKKTVRLIEDIGIASPMTVSGINDETVHKYFLLYPFSDYILSAVKAFRYAVDELAERQQQEGKRNAIKGDAVHDRLDHLDDNIKRIKETDSAVLSHGAPELPAGFAELSEGLKNKLANWESRKTKMTDSGMAYTTAMNFNSTLNRVFFEFCAELDNVTNKAAKGIRDQYIKLYKGARLDESYTDDLTFSPETPSVQLYDQTNYLLALKEEKYITQKNTLIGQLFRSSEQNSDQTPVLETTYYYQAWREHMINVITPVAEKIVKDKYAVLTNYSDKLADVYHIKLMKLLEQQAAARDNSAANLSEAEKLFQKENEWLERFTDRLRSIERS